MVKETKNRNAVVPLPEQLKALEENSIGTTLLTNSEKNITVLDLVWVDDGSHHGENMHRKESTMCPEPLRRTISNEGPYKRKLQDTSFAETETTKKEKTQFYMSLGKLSRTLKENG